MSCSEFDLIRRIQGLVGKSNPKIICGIGDDCAVVEGNDGKVQLLTTDCLVEGVHFDFSYFSARDVGYKAMAVNLSDVAAMGGTPLYALVTLGVPPSRSDLLIDELYSELALVAHENHVSIIGGDLSKSEDSLWINICLVGEVLRDHCKLRSGAKENDLIYVTGPLGLSRMGLEILKEGGTQDSLLTKAHLRPCFRLSYGKFLGSCPEVTSMIDISDGLLSDCGHLLESSQVGGRVYFDKVPHEKELEYMIEAGFNSELPLADLVLSGGEDYELLFTVNSQQQNGFLKKLKDHGCEFFEIGKIVNQSEGLKVYDSKGQEITPHSPGFDHFK